MNHDYKRTFSQIRPSEETIERILEMNKTKPKRKHWKGLLVAAICLISLLCGALSVNAATDGALFDGVRLLIDGEDVNLFAYLKEHRSYVQEDGTEVDEYVFEVKDGQDASCTVTKEEAAAAGSIDAGAAVAAQDSTDSTAESAPQQ